MEFINCSGISRRPVSIQAIAAHKEELLVRVKDKLEWLPVVMRRRADSWLQDDGNMKKLLSFLRLCAKHSDAVILTKRKSVDRDGKRTSEYLYTLCTST